MSRTLLSALAEAHRALATSDDERGGHGAGLNGAGAHDLPLASLNDDVLLEALEHAAAVRRLVDARAALLAGEVARRSTPELAHAGLAQRRGHRTPDELVRVTTGSSRHDARLAVRAGAMLLDAENASEPTLPQWAHRLIAPVMRGEISTAALDAMRSGLGDESATVSGEALASAVAELLADAGSLDVDRLFRRARQLRDELDTAGVVERERARRDARSLRVFRTGDGMTRAAWVLDPESAAIVIDLYDRATSPRRGGPTFLGADDAALIERMRDDERSPEQYASDTFLELLRAGADADASALLSTGAPSVRVIVTARELAGDAGMAHLEGQPEPVSLPTTWRLLCAGTHTPILLSSTGQPLDVGRSQRLFTARQRIALAVRDGGCRWAGCDRPPSWCEAHHIEPWSTHGGRTDVADGVLLCRHHHLLVHNNGWQVQRHRRPDGVDDYRAIPPESVDPHRAPHAMPSVREPVRRAVTLAQRITAA